MLEGAAQPFLFEMVASQALHARLPSDPFIAGQSTPSTAATMARVEIDRLPAFLNDVRAEPGLLALVGGRPARSRRGEIGCGAVQAALGRS